MKTNTQYLQISSLLLSSYSFPCTLHLPFMPGPLSKGQTSKLLNKIDIQNVDKERLSLFKGLLQEGKRVY